MAIKSTTQTINTTASVLGATEDERHKGKLRGRDIGSSIAVVNTGATSLYVGGPDVSSVNGVEIPEGGDFSIDLVGPTDVLYGRTASGSTTVAILQAGV